MTDDRQEHTEKGVENGRFEMGWMMFECWNGCMGYEFCVSITQAKQLQRLCVYDE
jgi:hypothetical protein